jgi:hypothetical protein
MPDTRHCPCSSSSQLTTVGRYGLSNVALEASRAVRQMLKGHVVSLPGGSEIHPRRSILAVEKSNSNELNQICLMSDIGLAWAAEKAQSDI